MVNIIAQNADEIQKNIAAAAQKSGRKASDITLIGVTKTVDAKRIRTLLQAGVTHLGENRVQELLPKHGELSNNLIKPVWHFIGHLQRNKVRQIIDKVSLIHSVDGIGLALEINKRAEMAEKRMDILLEINIANEASKHGISPVNTRKITEQLFALPHVRLRGLMCVAPYVENGENNRSYFKKMFEIMLDIKESRPYNSTPQDLSMELSMGMSGDYAVAVEEGATMVRIGTALLGNA
jgi:hypothetical protein